MAGDGNFLACSGPTLTDLPSELIIEIFSHLDYNDLINCSYVNRRLYKLSSQQEHWKKFCQKYWLETECPSRKTWKQHFMTIYRDLGKYIDQYAAIKQAWDKILAFMRGNCPAIYLAINEGVCEEGLNDAEEAMGLKLPLDFRCSYRLHNGQRLTSPGLMGSMNIHNHHKSESLLDIDTICAGYQVHEGVRHCIPLTFCLQSGITQYMAVTNEDGYDCNTIFYLSQSDLADRHYPDAFITGTSFTEWLTEYADHLHNNDFVVLYNEPYRFLQDPQCKETTGYITISVATCFLPERSTVLPPMFYHCYRIIMSMSEDAPESEMCQLETRHWIVTDENGHEEEVYGHGVVGQYPVMSPGRTFSWVSCTSFPTTYGNMKGHFKMRNQYTGDETEVKCPTFHMKCLPYITAEERESNKRKNRTSS